MLPETDNPIVKNPRALAALQAYYADRERGKPDLGWLPENLRRLAEAFILISGREPHKSERSLWYKELGKWQEMGIEPADVEQATREARRKGWRIYGPTTVTKTAADRVSVRRANAATLDTQQDRFRQDAERLREWYDGD